MSATSPIKVTAWQSGATISFAKGGTLTAISLSLSVPSRSPVIFWANSPETFAEVVEGLVSHFTPEETKHLISVLVAQRLDSSP